jgi:hypothetical protein
VHRKPALVASAVLGLAVTAMLAAAALAGHPPAAAASGAAAPSWMVKGQDLLAWDPYLVVHGKRVYYPSIGLQACSQGAKPCPRTQRITLPSFTWRLCGRWGAHVYGLSDDTQCTAQANRTLVFENYSRFKAAINDGMFSKLKMHQSLFDLETWKASGKESKDPSYWIMQALQLAHKHDIRLMITLGGGLGRCYACMTTAADDGAYKVSVQSQGATTLAGFKSHVRDALKAVGNRRSLIIVGLGTNTPGVHDVSLLRSEYGWARSAGLDQFWLNANNWVARNKCRNAQGGRGCPDIGVQFLASP